MNRLTASLFLSLLISGASSMNVIADPGAPVAIAIHAGSGTIRKSDFNESREREVRATLEQAVRAGHQILASGGSGDRYRVAAQCTRIDNGPPRSRLV